MLVSDLYLLAQLADDVKFCMQMMNWKKRI